MGTVSPLPEALRRSCGTGAHQPRRQHVAHGDAGRCLAEQRGAGRTDGGSQAVILSKADLLAIEREACKRSLATFVREAWDVLEPGTPYVHGWHVEAICEHLEAVTRGEINRLLINVPPGTMKSTLTSVFWPAWEWGPAGMPHKRI